MENKEILKYFLDGEHRRKKEKGTSNIVKLFLLEFLSNFGLLLLL